MGHSTLNRKMKALLDMTPNDYIRTKRLAAAADMLESGKHRVNEVCYAVGFNSPSYFAKCFKKAYGVLPAEWAKDKTASGKDAE
jgi:AraC-like DNA-binding protein